MQKITIQVMLGPQLLKQVDRLVGSTLCGSRSELIEQAIAAHVASMRRASLTDACLALDPAEERALAEEGIAGDAGLWPTY